jgi:uncharacterized cupin superfamily protein
MRRINVSGLEMTYDDDDPNGYAAGYNRFGPAIDASRLGATVYELPPGQSICPYHYEYPDEEWLLVLSGKPTLRDPDGEHELEPNDLVCFPEGPDGAHKVTNNTDETLRVMMLSTKNNPGVAIYPDSDKIGVWPIPGGGDDQFLGRRSDRAEYFDGEL